MILGEAQMRAGMKEKRARHPDGRNEGHELTQWS